MIINAAKSVDQEMLSAPKQILILASTFQDNGLGRCLETHKLDLCGAPWRAVSKFGNVCIVLNTIYICLFWYWAYN